MKIETFYNIEELNKNKMLHYMFDGIENHETLVIIGHNDSLGYYIEIRFIYVEYIACPLEFSNDYSFRVATKEEADMIRASADFITTSTIYCIEETEVPIPSGRAAYKYFIASEKLEIRVPKL